VKPVPVWRYFDQVDFTSVTLACGDRQFKAHSNQKDKWGYCPVLDCFKMNDVRDEAPSQYNEKKWGKTEDGQYIIDGYAFRGKQSFNKVVEGMKKFFKKGIEHVMDGIKTKALDAREKGNKSRYFSVRLEFGL
jgi:hypothetical protein